MTNIEKTSDRNNLEVILNVYDLHGLNHSNQILTSVGVGMFHTGIEIDDFEFTFSSRGIFKAPPRQEQFGKLREQIKMGKFKGTQREIDTILNNLKTECGFDKNCYNLTSRNCNHFSDLFCLKLIGIPIPPWINRAAFVGSYLPLNLIFKAPEFDSEISRDTLEDDSRSDDRPLFSDQSDIVSTASSQILCEETVATSTWSYLCAAENTAAATNSKRNNYSRRRDTVGRNDDAQLLSTIPAASNSHFRANDKLGRSVSSNQSLKDLAGQMNNQDEDEADCINCIIV